MRFAALFDQFKIIGRAASTLPCFEQPRPQRDEHAGTKVLRSFLSSALPDIHR